MSRTVHAKFPLLFLSILLLQQLPLFGQPKYAQNPTRIPVYRSAKDSVRLAQIEESIRELGEASTPQIQASDSLISLYRKLYPLAVTGFRQIYRPDRTYVTLDSLLKIEDLLSVNKISLYDYHSTELPPVIFECKNLVSLELIKTNIRKLPESLNSLIHLKQIKTYNHRGRRLKLKKNNFVKELLVSGSTARILPRSYRSFSALEKLDLAGNWLNRFPRGIRQNKNLRELNLQENKLRLNQKLRKNPYLETLALQHNQVRKLPSSIHAFTNLKKLNLNHNQISSVHRNIRFLDKLEHLSFYNNQLSSIPLGLYGLTELREIDLFYNSIETVDESIGRWKNLRMLYLSHNKILSLPESIGELSSLEGLYIWDNRISALPETLGEIRKLRFLWVNDNNLASLPSSLSDLELIEELDLSGNFLTSVPHYVFDFKHLKILSLMDNPWNQEAMDLISRRTPLLRSKNVFVHIPER